MKVNRFKIHILIIFVLFLFFAFQAEAQKKTFRTSVDSEGIQRVEIVGGEYYFEPDHIVVKVNVPVELTMRKVPGITPHNIIIDAPEAGIDLHEDLRKEPVTVTFTPMRTGTYAIFCDKRFLFFKSHQEKGMEGALEVIE